MSKPSFTPRGLKELAYIVKQARLSQGLTPPQFAQKVGLSHITIWKIETESTGNLRQETLDAVAPYVGYTGEQLRRICEGVKPEETKLSDRVVTASDVLAIVKELPPGEQVRVAIALFERLDLSGEELITLMDAINKKVISKLKH